MVAGVVGEVAPEVLLYAPDTRHWALDTVYTLGTRHWVLGTRTQHDS